VRPCTIIALVWCSLITMLSSASIRCGNVGAGSTTPTISTARPSTRTDFPTTPGSPPKRFIQYSCVSTMTGGTEVPSSASLSSRPRTGDRPMTWK
jgi:hypothetical protein